MQTIIEPTVDMLLRSTLGNNVVVNDPKGELTKMFFVPATLRGYQVVQFNLIKKYFSRHIKKFVCIYGCLNSI